MKWSKRIIPLLAILGVARGGFLSCAPIEAPAGRVALSVAALSSHQINRVTVDVEPNGVTAHELEYDRQTGEFGGNLMVAVGEQTFTVKAYYYGSLVAEGSAISTVEAGATANIFVTVVELLGSEEAPDHGPIITSMVVPGAEVNAGESLSLSASAVDVDDDELSYEWTSDCAGAVLSDPTSTNTEWISGTAEVCFITLNVTSGQLTVTRSVPIAVYGLATGQVAVSGELISHPKISYIRFSDQRSYYDSHEFSCYVQPTSDNATCSGSVRPGQQMHFELSHSLSTSEIASAQVSLEDNCGGMAYVSEADSWNSRVVGTWIAPSTEEICLVTATVSRAGLTASLPVAIHVDGCLDDRYEPNNVLPSSSSSSSVLTELKRNGSVISFSGLMANDPDVYPLDLQSGHGTLTVSLVADQPETLRIELYDSSKNLLAEGQATEPLVHTFDFEGYRHSYLRVVPDLAADTCGLMYSLSLSLN